MAQRVLIPQDIPEIGKEYLRSRGYEVVVGSGHDEDTLVREAAGCDAVIARAERYTRRVLAAARSLRVISRFGAGVDNIDLDAATELGIQVTNTPIANTTSIAEHTLAMLFACAKRLVRLNDQCRRGLWRGASGVEARAGEISGKTLGIVGLGHVGRMVAQKALYGLDMNVIAFDSLLPAGDFPENIVREESMADLFAASDFVTLHVPATPLSRGMVNRDMLGRMKPTAYLINCARGDLVNEEDLAAALRGGRLAGAALDVLREEPPPGDHPLLRMDNVIITPHTGALTGAAMDRMSLHAAKGVDEVLRGLSLTWPVNSLVEC